MQKLIIILSAIILCILVLPAKAQLLFDLETGAVVNTRYNEVRIPGNTGTQFDLADGFNSNPAWFYRVRAGYTFADRHTVFALFAPLSVDYQGTRPFPITFAGTTFVANTPIDARYTFNSYRLTYRFDFIRNDRFRLGIGATAKIRDAAIRLRNEQTGSTKTNVGFVPLINFYLAWDFACRFRLLVEGDALAAPQGRAEDVFAGLGFKVWEDKIILKAGYRVVEGGVNNDEVYNFTWIDYASLGVILRL